MDGRVEGVGDVGNGEGEVAAGRYCATRCQVDVKGRATGSACYRYSEVINHQSTTNSGNSNAAVKPYHNSSLHSQSLPISKPKPILHSSFSNYSIRQHQRKTTHIQPRRHRHHSRHQFHIVTARSFEIKCHLTYGGRLRHEDLGAGEV